ncbi:hypothetical protein FHR72_003501 [Mycolicibacterium iranicum]|uniref:Uncharacterized protein n=1 Tax=Mycolicibacterium iranicum TaxID=912594 RepID=A0A839QC10_MYCIR|nr:hypothetical protein [Mycolicibacterium iranicum]MBB2992005.1 hypothetical protein [Mycolicibacterium iranicum]
MTIWVYALFLVAGSYLADDPAHDPHGYGLMIGSVFLILGGAASTLVVPYAFTQRRRGRVRRLLLAVFALSTALTVVVPLIF